MENSVRIRDFRRLKNYKYDTQSVETITSDEQIATERLVAAHFDRFAEYAAIDPDLPLLHRENHIAYLEKCLRGLPEGYCSLDSSRPWLVYWILNSAALLNHRFTDSQLQRTVEFLKKCQSPIGGFAGGPGQYPHLAPTYAAVNALSIIGTASAFEAIDREALVRFLRAIREPNGAFRMHIDGELDVRGAYCAIAAAKLSAIPAEEFNSVFSGTAEWIASCQTYEGGFGGAPDLEAHGGYSFCAAAALALLGKPEVCDLKALLRWTVNRQMVYEGGFQGRTNKLVDSCYSFWQGSLVVIVQTLMASADPFAKTPTTRPMFYSEALQEYILICCQRPSGGFIDKPGKSADVYHTCYALSGLSIAQHAGFNLEPAVIGYGSNELLPTHPVHNVPPSAVNASYSYCSRKKGKSPSVATTEIEDIWDDDSERDY
ncbi:protein farnesyltransferase subunit beta [Phlebotomus argentipes]|uniref:protein farnesyltransferase subunit beta n=1 Tax=Phlebotomus argentipes TaxID=94469 RepID=UPI002893460F|nr:protein farnesyltransferase subunit beta [Phlebotomus argentipes]